MLPQTALLKADQKSSSTILVLEKALNILSRFDGNRTEWGVTELSKDLRINKSTVSKILSTSSIILRKKSGPSASPGQPTGSRRRTWSTSLPWSKTQPRKYPGDWASTKICEKGGGNESRQRSCPGEQRALQGM
jgi:hypothetical protein